MPRLHAPLALFPLLACAQVDPSTAASSTTTVASTTTTPSDPTTTTADHGTSAESTPTEGFIMTPDHGGVNSLECDPFAQACPPGQKCVPWVDNGGGAWNATKCVDITGDGAPGDPGLVCIDPLDASSACDPLVLGCCQPFCELPDATCPNPDQQCVPFFDPMLPDIPPGYDKIGTCRIPS